MAVTPKVCDPLDSSQYSDLIGEVDVVIDAVGGDSISKVGHAILDACLTVAPRSRPNGPPLSYIYCSGTWVHGDSLTETVSDRTPIDRPSKLTSWRLEIEQKAVKNINKSFTANVVRPSLLYGGSGSLIGMTVFKGAKEGKITWYGSQESRLATIHKEDLGEAFRLVAEKVRIWPRAAFGLTDRLTLCSSFYLPLTIITSPQIVLAHASTLLRLSSLSALSCPRTLLLE